MNRLCPICRKPAAREHPAFPFCSERCKLFDLARWMGEEYRIPAGDEESTSPPPPEEPSKKTVH
jgi:endogenous inhibitor of DNA gyrase (YacG/DUF329 family)